MQYITPYLNYPKSSYISNISLYISNPILTSYTIIFSYF